MSEFVPQLFPLGDNALTADFGNEISADLNDVVLRLFRYFEANRFPGYYETVPAYASLTIFYDTAAVKKAFPDLRTAFDAVASLVGAALRNLPEAINREDRLIEIPVSFDPEAALDLEFVAASRDLTSGEVIDIFISGIYRVYMLGFLPGFAYMGEVDERIAAPRREVPRLRVPAGSVGIAGRQTGIYPLESPGGWQIIGRTDQRLFRPDSDPPSTFAPGDRVRFYKV